MFDAQSVVKQEARVRFDRQGIAIDGVPVVVLCSSVFYFRIPRGLWRDRLRKVKEAGYNAIDVYFPWNYHERHPGVWDFTGERDVEAFLQIASEEGLWVIARPGPYICSEWDGGGLPAYLFTNRDMRLRDNDPAYLEAVSRWFERILPMLKRFELGAKGTVISVQLENELDFYDCREPAAYIEALRDLALKQGMTVPLFACAGQGDLYRASGYAAEVMPTCNFYPNDMDPEFEDKVTAYYRELQSRNYPLCVTETNRSHFLLRRLLAGGAKLLGPYLQTSGTNFGFHNAINNWGKPLAFLTSDYDFHGMLTPVGVRRGEFYEGRLLSGFLQALGEELAAAEPVPSILEVDTELTVSSGMKYVLALGKQGYVISLPNVDGRDGSVSLRHHDGGSSFPRYTEYTVAKGRCPLLLYDYSLDRWGIEGKLQYSTAELASAILEENKLTLVTYADSDAELALELPAPVTVRVGEEHVRRNGTELVLCFSRGSECVTEMELPGGGVLEIRFLSRELAARLGGQEQDTVSAEKENPNVSWRISGIAAGGRLLPESNESLDIPSKHLEDAGIYRGMAWYEAERNCSLSLPVEGILLQDAGDVVSVYSDDQYAGTFTPGGGSVIVPLQQTDAPRNLSIRAEVWGHTNFDDSALPGLRMNSLKGVRGAVYVTKRTDLSRHWMYQHGSQSAAPDPAASTAMIPWGGWMTSGLPEIGTYHKTVALSAEADSWVMHFPELTCLVRVYVNGLEAGAVHPRNPYVDVTPFAEAGAELHIALNLERYYHQSAGKVVLLEGSQAVNWRVGGCEEEPLWKASQKASSAGTVSCELPLILAPGELTWLAADLPDQLEAACRQVSCSGNNMKLTAFFNGHLVGRLWTPGDARPHMTGGSQHSFYLPEPWCQDSGNRIALLVEAVGEQAEISQLTFQ